jgi:hypothetical protein
MKKLPVIVLFICMCSCSFLREGIHDNYILYYKTRAFFVVKEIDTYKRLLVNAQGTHYFIYTDYYNCRCEGDTILTREFLNELNDLQFINNPNKYMYATNNN